MQTCSSSASTPLPLAQFYRFHDFLQNLGASRLMLFHETVASGPWTWRQFESAPGNPHQTNPCHRQNFMLHSSWQICLPTQSTQLLRIWSCSGCNGSDWTASQSKYAVVACLKIHIPGRASKNAQRLRNSELSNTSMITRVFLSVLTITLLLWGVTFADSLGWTSGPGLGLGKWLSPAFPFPAILCRKQSPGRTGRLTFSSCAESKRRLHPFRISLCHSEWSVYEETCIEQFLSTYPLDQQLFTGGCQFLLYYKVQVLPPTAVLITPFPLQNYIISRLLQSRRWGACWTKTLPMRTLDWWMSLSSTRERPCWKQWCRVRSQWDVRSRAGVPPMKKHALRGCQIRMGVRRRNHEMSRGSYWFCWSVCYANLQLPWISVSCGGQLKNIDDANFSRLRH